MTSPLTRILAAAAFAAVPVAAAAQSTPPAVAPAERIAPPETAPGQAGRDCVPGTVGGPACESLTEKLDETGGVIRPPAGVDPEIQTGAPAPNPGTTPVIRPGELPLQPPQDPK